jgi:hypothetical protein
MSFQVRAGPLGDYEICAFEADINNFDVCVAV